MKQKRATSPLYDCANALKSACKGEGQEGRVSKGLGGNKAKRRGHRWAEG